VAVTAIAGGARRYQLRRDKQAEKTEVDRVRFDLARRFVCPVILVILATVTAFVAVSLAGDIDWSVSASISSRPSKLELSPVDRGSAYEIWAKVISSSYGVSIGFVKGLYDRGYGFDEVALILEFSSLSEKGPSDIAVLRKKGLGWGAIAKELGVHPSALKRAKGKESLFTRYVLANRLAGYYGIPDSEVLVLLSEKGYGFDDIVLAVNLCAHSGAALRDIIKTRETAPKWKGVAEKFKVSPVKLSAPPAKLKEERAKEKEKQKAKVGEKQKATSGGKAKGKEKASEEKGANRGCPKSCSESCSKRCW